MIIPNIVATSGSLDLVEVSPTALEYVAPKPVVPVMAADPVSALKALIPSKWKDVVQLMSTKISGQVQTLEGVQVFLFCTWNEKEGRWIAPNGKKYRSAVADMLRTGLISRVPFYWTLGDELFLTEVLGTSLGLYLNDVPVIPTDD